MEFVWFFWSSWAGKETFIRKIIENPELGNRFLSWWPIMLSDVSVSCISHNGHDEVVTQRERIITTSYLDKNYSILLKGQNIDLKKDFPNLLIKRYPEAQHKLIFLNAPYEILLQRCRTKFWWNLSYEEWWSVAHDERLEREQIALLKKIARNQIYFIDSSNFEYKELPPVWEIRR